MIKLTNKRINVVLILKVILIVVILTIALYIILLLNTNSLMREVRDAFLLKTPAAETVGREINRYNRIRLLERDRDVEHIHLTLIRLFTIHNFREGYIWVYYTYQAYDEDGNLLNGSQSIISKWRIEKINGEWEIVEIFEDP